MQKDNGEFTDITSSYESGYSVTENGAYTFRVTDNAGRTAEQTLEYENIDSAKPVVTINATHGGETYTSGAWTNKDITLMPTNETSNLALRPISTGWTAASGRIILPQSSSAPIQTLTA